jgi:predicted Zn-dependent protease with MMP-like domain
MGLWPDHDLSAAYRGSVPHAGGDKDVGQETVRHEVGHHVGHDDARLEELMEQ